MSLATILIALVFVALYIFAIRYLAKNGSCAGCSSNCPAYRLCKTKAARAGKSSQV